MNKAAAQKAKVFFLWKKLPLFSRTSAVLQAAYALDI